MILVRLARSWAAAIEPARSVVGPYRRRRARSITASCAVLAVLTPVGFTAATATGSASWLLLAAVAAVPTFTALSVYSRRGHHELTAVLALPLLIALAVAGVLGADTPRDAALVLVFLSIPVGVAMGVFDAGRTAAVAGVALAVGLALASLAPVDGTLAAISIVFLLVSSALLVGGAAVIDADRQELESALTSARRLFDATSEGIAVHRHGVILEANAQLARMLGAGSPDELIGRSLVDFVDPVDAGQIRSRLARGGEQRYELEVIRADGTRFRSASVGRPWELPDGSARLTTVRDVTAARAESQRLQLAIETGAMGFWEWDAKSERFRFSPELVTLYGLSHATAFDGTVEAGAALVDPDDRDAVQTAFARLFQEDRMFEVEHGVVTRPGARFLSRGKAQRTSSGEVVGVLGVTIDISDRVALEERVRRAERLETVGRLAGGVAHDFNNLLTVVAGFAGLLRESVRDNPEAVGYASEIVAAADRGADLTRQLLAFGGRQVLRPTALDVNDLITTTRPLLERLLGDDGAIVTVLDPDVPPVRFDRAQLELVFVNLVLNARDAMPAGGTLTIATCPSSAPGHVEVRVSDTGIGMSDEVRERIFEPFFTTKRPGEGTGLGLASAYGVLTQGGGSIHVASVEGEGACFTLELPVAEPAPSRAVRERVSRLALGRGQSVLLVEDDPHVRRLAGRALERAGFSVIEAGDAAEALRAVADLGELDLLVTDVVMPGVGGIELSRILGDAFAGLRTLFTSGYSAEVVSARGELPAGGWFLAKPYTPEQLRAAVARLLQSVAPAAGPPTTTVSPAGTSDTGGDDGN